MNQRRQSLAVGLEGTGDASTVGHPQEKLMSWAGARPREVSCAISGKVRGMELLQAIKFGRSCHQL